MATTPGTLWETIAALEQRMPVSKEAVEALFSVSLAEVSRSEYFVNLSAKQQFALKDELSVTAINMMLRPNLQFDEKSSMTFELSGRCVGLDEVRKVHAELELVQPPTGRSLQEVAAWGARRSWGLLWFGFRQDRPDCLFSVTLRRQAL